MGRSGISSAAASTLEPCSGCPVVGPPFRSRDWCSRSRRRDRGISRRVCPPTSAGGHAHTSRAMSRFRSTFREFSGDSSRQRLDPGGDRVVVDRASTEPRCTRALYPSGTSPSGSVGAGRTRWDCYLPAITGKRMTSALRGSGPCVSAISQPESSVFRYLRDCLAGSIPEGPHQGHRERHPRAQSHIDARR